MIRIAAALAILFSFSPKFEALVAAMPAATMGGVSMILYGMISAVGVRNVVENKVDFTKSRNVLIAAIIMVLSIGISYSAAGAVKFTVGGVGISLSGLAVGAVDLEFCSTRFCPQGIKSSVQTIRATSL